MSFSLNCPNCGPRPVAEFRWGGEGETPGGRDSRRAVAREGETPVEPANPAAAGPGASPEEWAHQLYRRANVEGPQDEWWYHRLGCRRWFQARRDTRDNRVERTWWPGTDEG